MYDLDLWTGSMLLLFHLRKRTSAEENSCVAQEMYIATFSSEAEDKGRDMASNCAL